MSPSPILVTGEQRTGSSWITQILATAGNVAWLDEPFNHKKSFPWLCEALFPNWYTYVANHNGATFHGPVGDTLSYRFNLLANWRRSTSFNHLRRAWQIEQQFQTYRRTDLRPLVKQPTGLFMAEWLANSFQAQVVILVRHPAGYVSSRKRLGWQHNFNDFLDQPQLMQNLLAPFAAEIHHFAAHKQEIVVQLSLLWKIFFATAHHYPQIYPNWLLLRYEDLALDPHQQFNQLFNHLGLTFSTQTEQVIAQSSQAENPPEVPVKDWKSVRRDSPAAAMTWKTRLTKAEIRQIREIVAEVGQLYYGDDEW